MGSHEINRIFVNSKYHAMSKKKILFDKINQQNTAR